METIIIYLVATLIACISMHFATKNADSKKISKFALIISFLTLFLLIILRRSDVGTDYQVYARVYERIINGIATATDLQWLGTTFVAFCQLVGFIANEKFIILISIIGFLTMFFIYKGTLQNSRIPWLSIFLFITTCLYYQTFNQFRQMLAIAIVLYSIKYMKEQKFIKFALTIALATVFHETALIMIPVYFLAKLKINWKTLLFYTSAIIVAFLGQNIIMNILSHTSYNGYINSYRDVEFGMATILNTILRSAMLITTIIFAKKTIAQDANNKYLYHMVIICTALQFMTLSSGLFSRLTTYFFIFYILLIPEIITAVFQKPKTKFAIILIILIGFTCYNFAYFNTKTAIDSGYTNYYFYFEEGYR